MRKEMLILEALGRLVVAESKDLTILAGYHDESVLRKKMRQLKEDGFVNINSSGYGYGTPLIYSLTKQGMREVDIYDIRPFEYRGQNTWHEIMVGHAASFLYIYEDLSIYDMEFDRAIRGKKSEYIPDIAYGNNTGAVEVELSVKSKKRLEDKFLRAFHNYNIVRWIYPAECLSIKHNLIALANKHNIEPSRCRIFSVDSMLAKIKDWDIKNNYPRYDIKEESDCNLADVAW